MVEPCATCPTPDVLAELSGQYEALAGILPGLGENLWDSALRTNEAAIAAEAPEEGTSPVELAAIDQARTFMLDTTARMTRIASEFTDLLASSGKAADEIDCSAVDCGSAEGCPKLASLRSSQPALMALINEALGQQQD